ncbi:MAG: nuclear transport factor 2 family protein [Silanimonas sp.]
MHDDRWAIFDLVARFDDAVNRRDAAEFRALWAEDAVWEIGEPRPMRVEGAATIADTWLGMVKATQWLFRGSFTGVVSIEDDTATGRWPCAETGVFADGTPYDNRSIYRDTYVKRDGRWLILSRHYTYLWLSGERLPGAPVVLDE